MTKSSDTLRIDLRTGSRPYRPGRTQRVGYSLSGGRWALDSIEVDRGRAPRMATNARTRGSRRSGSGSRAGPDDDPDEADAGPAARQPRHIGAVLRAAGYPVGAVP